MREILRAAMVIARRDYVASVWSKAFIFFLLGPLLPVIAGAVFGAMGSTTDRKATHPVITVIAGPEEARLLASAHDDLAGRLGPDRLPDLKYVAPQDNIEVQTKALLADEDERAFGVMRGSLDAPTFIGPRRQMAETSEELGLIYDQARRTRALEQAGAVPPPVKIITRPVDKAAGTDASSRVLTARLGQMVLMLLTMILAGMLLSNLIEEKSNKVIEVLAAAVPVDAIFLGKLIAMLGMSLTGIAIWGSAGALALFAFVPSMGAAPPPAVGWPAFIALGVAYFVGCYLLLGALFLGIGAQASTVREVQTLSMPVTMGQLGVVGLASSTVGDPNGALGLFATVFPWSSPYAMLARAAQVEGLAPHLLAIGWQAIWVALIIRVASRLFRRSVLKSGSSRRWFRRAARTG